MDGSQREPGLRSDGAHALAPTIRPSPFHLGTTYEGAILEGSFLITPARTVSKVHVDKPNGQDLLELRSSSTCSEGLAWEFRARTDMPSKCLVFVGFWTDCGMVSSHFVLEVKPGCAPGGRVFFCESPFSASSSHGTHAQLGLMTRELRVQVNAAKRLPEDLAQFDVVILHGTGLDFLVQGAAIPLNRYLEAGGRVILLASHCYRDTVMHANHLAEAHGIQLEDREYDEILCNRSQIENDPATNGVGRLRWFRPSPMIVKDRAKILVRNPDDADEGFVACSGPHQNLFVIGCSMLRGLVCEGWPFENARLFANLLSKPCGHCG